MITANTPVELDMTGITLEKIKVTASDAELMAKDCCEGCFFDTDKGAGCSNVGSKYSKAAGLGLCYVAGSKPAIHYIFKQVESAEVSE